MAGETYEGVTEMITERWEDIFKGKVEVDEEVLRQAVECLYRIFGE